MRKVKNFFILELSCSPHELTKLYSFGFPSDIISVHQSCFTFPVYLFFFSSFFRIGFFHSMFMEFRDHFRAGFGSKQVFHNLIDFLVDLPACLLNHIYSFKYVSRFRGIDKLKIRLIHSLHQVHTCISVITSCINRLPFSRRNKTRQRYRIIQLTNRIFLFNPLDRFLRSL